MADRAFDRAFSRAAAADESTGAEWPRPRKQATKPDIPRADEQAATPMQMSDAVQRMLQADKDKNYFRYTGLRYNCSGVVSLCSIYCFAPTVMPGLQAHATARA